MSEERSKNIIAELRRSFLEDKKVLQEQIVEAETEIRQCKDFIESLTRKDDNDYNVFSPRRASSVYKGQVEEKKAEIATLEEEVRNLYKREEVQIHRLHLFFYWRVSSCFLRVWSSVRTDRRA